MRPLDETGAPPLLKHPPTPPEARAAASPRIPTKPLVRALPRAILAALLAASPLAHASPDADPFGDDETATEPGDPFDDGATTESEDHFTDDDVDGDGSDGVAAIGDALHPDLAADAPQSEWQSEGGGGGGQAGPSSDPRTLNRKIRRAGRITLAGGGLVLLGGLTSFAGVTLLYIWTPQQRLEKLADENGGFLPTDDPDRHRIIASVNTAPIVLSAGLGILAAGLVTTITARVRLKRLRDQRKAATVSLSPSLYRGGAGLGWKVRF